jgi:translocation and assembly module TamB
VKLTGKATGGGGLSVQVAGSVGATAGGALDLKVTGAVPLSLANARLADRGAALQGTAKLDLAVTGTTAAPRFAGRVTADGASFADPGSGVTLRSLSLAASLSNDRLTIERLTGQSGKGTLTASGSIGLQPGGGFPADLKAEIRRAHYADGTLVATTFDADLTLTGSLVAGPTLGGSVTLDRTDITVPERLPRGSVAIDVKHIHTPPAVLKTLTLVRDRSRERHGGSDILLNLKIDAPREIFVRGRGIDAEMGGHLTLRGPLSALIADGAFAMRRGRVDLLTQRITFDRGTVTFAGDLDPVLDFSGSTSTQDITVTVTVTGDASDPQIGFSSSPELPQDEVLAHLIFNKGIADLSPVQIARLASVVTGGSLLNRLRESTGLDDLDIVTDETGGAALAAGRYISDNVYLGVQQGTGTGSTRVTVDLDVTKEVKVRGAVSPDGDSSLGVFFEHEY